MNGPAMMLVLTDVFEDAMQRTMPLHRITRLQYAYLRVIACHPGICAYRAGRILGLTHSSSYYAVKALVKMELVSRQEDPLLYLPKGIPLYLTPAGQHLLTVFQEAGL